jgi:diguanylate cyclase
MNSPSAPKLQSERDTSTIALSKQALSEMANRKLPPVPENYAIFYHAALGQDTELIKELDNISRNNIPFTSQTTSYLFKKYVIADRNSTIVHDTAANANRLLGDVLRAVNSFGKETSDYNADVGEYITKLEVDIPDPNVQNMIRELLSASSEIRQQGEELNRKLEKSKDEIENLKKNLDQVTTESQRDFLTGVFNRKAYDRMLDEQINEAKTHGKDLCLLMIDIDHFKQFNDKFGHLLGDEVLKIVAKSLTDSVRGRDIVSRYGGEEFSVVLPDTPVSGAVKVAETICKTIAARELKRRDNGESYGVITVSIGVSILRHGTDSQLTLIKRADEALYLSKNRGRNRVTIEGQ